MVSEKAPDSKNNKEGQTGFSAGPAKNKAQERRAGAKAGFEGFGWRDWAVRPWLWLPAPLAHSLSPQLLKVYRGFCAARRKAAGLWRGRAKNKEAFGGGAALGVSGPGASGPNAPGPNGSGPWTSGPDAAGPYKWAPFFWRGLYFPNPLGPAGGLDKNGLNIRDWWALGAGFCEIGTITPLPQTPNKGRILSRSLREQALWNHMGFPNRGLDFARRRLEELPPPQLRRPFKKEGGRGAGQGAKEALRGGRAAPARHERPRRAASQAGLSDSSGQARPAPVFVNIGKNRETPLARAEEDYHKSLRSLCHLADAFVINISSPNTEGLRELFGEKRLPRFLSSLKQALNEAGQAAKPGPPLILKLSPDEGEKDFRRLIDQALEAGMDGFCLGNSSAERQAAAAAFPPYGGVSGRPLARKSLFLLRALTERLRQSGAKKGDKLVVSCGGVLTPSDVLERLSEGADLAQAYSALALKGPGFLRNVSARAGAALEGQRPPMP